MMTKGNRMGLRMGWRSFLLFSFLLSLSAIAFCVGSTGVLSGKIVDGATGKGIEQVFLTAKTPSDTFTAITDRSGFFSLVGVPAGTYSLTVNRVGYQTITLTDVAVTADASTNLSLSLTAQPISVQGVTVTAARYPLLNPRETMTNYGYTQKELDKVLPPVGPNLQIPNLYETLPGVQISYDAYYGANAPHIRGGTGSDVAYAFDGIPTYEPVTNTFGTALMNVGTASTDFYVGAYPAQYGNFVSGFVNQVVKRGYGLPHGTVGLQYGAWTDPGQRLPSYSSTTGNLTGYPNNFLSNPAILNMELSGQDRRFHYYVNHLIQDQGLASYANGVDVKPLITEATGGGIPEHTASRDTVVNLTYDLDQNNGLQFLYYTGLQNIGYAGYQELPCNPLDSNVGGCQGTNNAVGFGETFNPYNITALSSTSQAATYSLEKLEWEHHFKPGSLLNFRLWKYEPETVFSYFDLPNSAWQFRRSAISGVMLEHQNQLTPQHLFDAGLSMSYANNFTLSSSLDIGAPNNSSDSYLNGAQSVLFNRSNPPGNTLNTIKVPDTQTWSAWLSDEWRPTDKWVIDAGLRYDRQNYLLLTGTGIGTASGGVPFVLNNLCPGSITGVCSDQGYFQPAQVSPRLGLSYKLSNKLTMKAGYGKFITFAPARDVDAVGLVSSTSIAVGAQNGTLPSANSLVAFQKAGSKPQRGESLDVSWEYQLDPNSYFRVTPYVKHITDPLESVIVSGAPTFLNAGTVQSKGIEFFLKTREWHDLSGWLSYTYSSTKGTQIPFETGIEGSLIGAPGSPFTAASVINDNNQLVPMSYDERHMLSVNLSYKVGKWEIAPSFQYGSGLPYGLGATNLRALSAVQDPHSVIYGGADPVPGVSSAYNPLGETTYNSLRSPGWWLGNLAVTYHISENADAILSVFNLFNSNQIISKDNQVGQVYQATATTTYDGYTESSVPNPAAPTTFLNYSSMDGTQKILPQYDPTKGQYAPIGYPNLRQFFLTLQIHY